MKKIAFTFVLIFLLPLCFFASENNLSENTELKKSKAGIVAIPDPKRPKTPDAEKCEEASSFDENSQTLQKYRDTLKYGVSSDIVDLLQKFISNDDPRLVNEVYDLFQKTKAIPTREKVLEYFAHFKDPCLEDYAIEILNDPYDIKNTTVSLVFQYVADVKCKSAVPAIITLLEANDHAYFNPCLAALGDIGGAEEALYLAEFIDRDDLTVAQKQSLARVLGKLHATETWEKLVSLAQDENENPFVRMYSAEAIGEMKKAESVPILVDLYESDDPNFRLYVIKGLANFPESEDAKRILIEGIRDEHYKVRLEAIAACKKMNFTEAVPMLVYRAKNEKETVVKKACYPAIALLNTKDGNEYLISMLKEKKLSDNTKAEAA
ncbi:MAG: HEAT repeat domain-containing protein, partial [Treponema sp.]|nr:HEAT repeat domain-containing protein [Treponema sp.]